jgi:AGZA family xanthine/uracil permease-like MFS transporter
MQIQSIARFFQFSKFETTWSKECLAGLTTFLTMSYIIFVNAHILNLAGMNFGAVFVATCLVTALGSFLVGFLANYPIAVAPGMALNVYFSFVIVQEMGYSWEAALGMTLIAGLLFLVISFTKTLRYFLEVIPSSLHHGLSAGIGIFIIIIGLKNGGLVDISPHIILLVQNVFTQQSVLLFIGLIILLALEYFKCIGSILISILLITFASLYFNLTQFHGFFALPPSLEPTWMKLDLHNIFSLDKLSIIFVFFLITLFDATGTFMGLLQNPSHKKLPKALFADSVATVVGAVIGTSSTSPFIESATGMRAGGRTGLTSIVTAVLFLLALFIFPLAETIPSFATAPALLYVGFLMASQLAKINFKSFSEAFPSLLTAIIIPIRFSIADGIAVGVISYCVIKLFTGKWKELDKGLILLALIFIIFLVMQFCVDKYE